MTTRKQPLLIYITTAGKDKNHWSYAEYEKAKDIDSGKVDTAAADRYLAFICEADEDADFSDPEVLKAQLIKANPGIGQSVLMENLLLQWEEAQGDPAKVDMFYQCQLNLWVQKYSGYISRSDWEACYEPFTMADLKGRTCFIGVDLGTSEDMTAVTLIFPYWEKVRNEEKNEEETRISYRIVPYFFVPQQALEEADKRKFKYRDKMSENLEVAGEVITAYETVHNRIKTMGKELYKAHGIILDPAYANELSSNLMNDKFNVEEISQKGWALAAAVRRFKELVKSGRIKHNNNALLNWNVQNARLETKGEGEDRVERISKTNSVGKIDGLSAGIFALHGAVSYIPPGGSVYEKRGVRKLA